MRILRTICLVCALSFCFGIAASALDVSAETALLVTGDGLEIYEKCADRRMAPASTTKIMTALLAIESCELSREISVDARAVGVEGSSIYLCAGEILTAEQLLFAVMLESANDAAAALACAVGGSIEGFVAMMNEKAASLGLTDTHFDNPHGLYSESHYTTARDLARLTSAALKNEIFRRIVSCERMTIPMPGGSGTRVLSNHNRLLREYDGALGVKTGFTKKSGRCLVSAAERDGLLLICVTMNAPNDWRDHTALLDYGFENYFSFRPDKTKLSLHVIGGENSEISVTSKDDLALSLKKGGEEIKTLTELSRFAYAPLSEGDCVGRIRYFSGGVEIGQTELIVTEDCARIEYKISLWEWIKDLFKWKR